MLTCKKLLGSYWIGLAICLYIYIYTWNEYRSNGSSGSVLLDWFLVCPFCAVDEKKTRETAYSCNPLWTNYFAGSNVQRHPVTCTYFKIDGDSIKKKYAHCAARYCNSETLYAVYKVLICQIEKLVEIADSLSTMSWYTTHIYTHSCVLVYIIKVVN